MIFGAIEAGISGHNHGYAYHTTETKRNLQVRGAMAIVQHELVCEARQEISSSTGKLCRGV